MTRAPDAAAIAALAEAALARMPEAVRRHLGGIVFQVEEFADEEALAAVGLDDPWDLSGLYEGRPLTEQSIWDSGGLPPRIRLFRRPLLDEWAESGEALGDLVTHVLVHEVGHHFGLSDADMEALEQEMGGQ